MSSVTLLEKNGSTPHVQDDSWLQVSTRTFFSSFNWDDNPPEVQEIKQQVVDQALDEDQIQNLTVGQFFSFVNWDDEAVAAPLSSSDSFLAELLEEPNSEFTLEDFSGLF
ncbi:MAG: hypothetical protein AAFY26_19155 [Cyanobacteria bacterium J06638_22]